LNLVEGLTLSKTKKKADRGGAGIVETQAPNNRKRDDFNGCRSGRAHVRRERCQRLENDHHNPEKNNKRKHRDQKKKMLQTQPLEEKERCYTVRLFGMNSLKEGAMGCGAESRNI
jgi:hypothetical protein